MNRTINWVTGLVVQPVQKNRTTHFLIKYLNLIILVFYLVLTTKVYKLPLVKSITKQKKQEKRTKKKKLFVNI